MWCCVQQTGGGGVEAAWRMMMNNAMEESPWSGHGWPGWLIVYLVRSGAHLTQPRPDHYDHPRVSLNPHVTTFYPTLSCWLTNKLGNSMQLQCWHFIENKRPEKGNVWRDAKLFNVYDTAKRCELWLSEICSLKLFDHMVLLQNKSWKATEICFQSSIALLQM